MKIIWPGNQFNEIRNLEHMKHNYGIKMTLLTAFAFPPSCICRSWSQVQFVSSWVERTNVTWTPKLLWTAEQSIHMNTPYVTLAHVGFFALQSKHTCKLIIYDVYKYYQQLIMYLYFYLHSHCASHTYNILYILHLCQITCVIKININTRKSMHTLTYKHWWWWFMTFEA